MKIASIDDGFAGTDVFYEMVGFDQATIARIRAQKRRNQARMILNQNQFRSVEAESSNSPMVEQPAGGR